MIMKLPLVALAFFLAITPAVAETVSAADAAAHTGQTATVEGVVSNVHQSSGGTVFLDLGGSFPNNTFAAVIFPSDTSKFPEVNSLSGKKVDITGPIQEYRGKPEIILKSANQLKVVQ